MATVELQKKSHYRVKQRKTPWMPTALTPLLKLHLPRFKKTRRGAPVSLV